jgi:hypothetical protein
MAINAFLLHYVAFLVVSYSRQANRGHKFYPGAHTGEIKLERIPNFAGRQINTYFDSGDASTRFGSTKCLQMMMMTALNFDQEVEKLQNLNFDS